MQIGSSEGDRLDSWKEIGDYLDRDERTVQRWESECGLPIYRTPGRKRGSVYAFKQELDAWLKRRDVPASEAAEESEGVHQAGDSVIGPPSFPTEIPPDQLNPKKITESKKKTVWVFCVALIMVAAVGISLTVVRAPAVASIAPVQKLTDDGYAKGNLRTDGTILYFNEFKAGQEVLAASPIAGGSIRLIDTRFTNVELQDISADGKELLVTSFEGYEKSGRPLWVLPVQGGIALRVGDVLCDSARWSPDNRKIACTLGTTILLVDSKGSFVGVTKQFPLIPRSLLWAPDGRKLRFVLCNDNDKKYVPWELSIERDESAPLNLVGSVSRERNCCGTWFWTKDGRSFLYTIPDPSGRPTLFIKQQRGWWAREGQAPILAVLGDAVPSRDSGKFYALIYGEPVGQLLKFDSHANAFQAFHPGLSADSISFSPDGRWMVYRRRPDFSLWRSRVDGSEAIRITEPDMESEYSAWSPDGRQIAFMAHKPGKPWRIFLTDIEGRTTRDAAKGTDNQGAPTWSRDGKMIVYGNTACEKTQPCWIRRIHLDTGEEELLPGSYGFRTARSSPDGRYILALQNETHQLMLFDERKQDWTVLANAVTGDNPNWSSDSQYIFVDTFQGSRPIIERIRISDHQRKTFVDLTALRNSHSLLDPWIGMAPDQSLILFQLVAPSDVYALKWIVP